MWAMFELGLCSPNLVYKDGAQALRWHQAMENRKPNRYKQAKYLEIGT